MGGGMGKRRGLFHIILQHIVIDLGQMPDFIAALDRNGFPAIQVIHTFLDGAYNQETVHDQGQNGNDHKEEYENDLAVNHHTDITLRLDGAVFTLFRSDAVAVIHSIGSGGD